MDINKFIAFFKLIRVKNLLFIILAQYLFRFCIIIPLFELYDVSIALTDIQFFILSISTVLIAAGGYIINDYFDVKIDQVNKPETMIVDRLFRRQQAMVLHWVITGIGIIAGLYISFSIGRIHLAGFHILAATLLWFYSTNFKKTVLLGNIVVSLLTALVIVIVAVFEIWIINRPVEYTLPVMAVFAFVMIYGGFAFLISMVREIIKDIEDVKGDAAHDCKTLPVIYGVKTAGRVVNIFNISVIALAVIIMVKTIRDQNWILSFYGLIVIIVPVIYSMFRISRAETRKSYTFLSALIKFIMLAGILSMLILYLFESPENYLNVYGSTGK